MRWAVVATGIVLVATGAWALLLPTGPRGILSWLLHSRRYGLVIILRLSFGLVLLLGAGHTRWPAASLLLGLLFLLGASMVPLLGEDRIGKLVAWWLSGPPAWLRAWGLSVVATGLFTLWLAS